MIAQAMKRLVLSGLLAAAPALADETARIRELEQKLERSLQLIEALAAKVQRLEQGAAAPAAPAGDSQARVEALERQVEQLGAGLSRRSLEEAVQLRGFADVGYAHSGENNPRRGRKGFEVGNLNLYLTPQLGERIRTLVELVVEMHGGHAEVDLERIQIGYAFDNAATGWLGRFHTPYGYWNTAYHHGAQLQTSILRPRFLSFEGHTGILPAHTVGAWLTGSVPAAVGRLGYDLYGGNAPRLEVDASGVGSLALQAAGRTRHAYLAGFNAWLEPKAADGLRLGIHGLGGAIDDDTAAANRTRLGFLGGYGVYSAGPWEVMGEYYRFLNRDLSGGTGSHHSWAGFVQAGYRTGVFTPFLRLENARLDQSDNYFQRLRYGRSYGRAAVGLRYDLDAQSALKVELAHTDQRDPPGGEDRYNEARFQYSIRF